MALPGSPKAAGSGRKKGTINKSSVPAREMAKKLGIDPFKILLYFAAGDWKALGYDTRIRITGYSQSGDAIEDYTIPPALQQKAARDACEYIMPKLKSVEHSGPEGGPIATEVTYDTAWRDAANPDKENA